MKRYIDLSDQIGCDREGPRYFSWFDTSVDQFESHSDSQIWSTWEEFEADYKGEQLDRYRRLFPFTDYGMAGPGRWVVDVRTEGLFGLFPDDEAALKWAAENADEKGYVVRQVTRPERPNDEGR